MDWVEMIVHTTTEGADIVSEWLTAVGATGTMIEDRADVPDPAHPNGFWEIIDPKMIEAMPEDVLVHAWFQPDAGLVEQMSNLQEQLKGLRTLLPDFDLGTLQVENKSVKDEDWSEVWKRFYKPFSAGERLVVKPTWEPYDAQPDDLVIEMDPGMAFGSGTHETTGMCLALLEKAVKPGDRVIDVGTGSGILAIGAALLGAGDVLAIDIDPSAVKVAKENIAHNGLTDKIHAEQGNLLDKANNSMCEVCVANIIADVICMFAAPLVDHIVPNGLFVCSGIIKEREQDVHDALIAADYEILEISRRGEWVAFMSRRHA